MISLHKAGYQTLISGGGYVGGGVGSGSVFQASMSKTKGNPKDAETLQSYLVEKGAMSNRQKEQCVCLVPF